MSHEMQQCVKYFGWTYSDLQTVTINALGSSFTHFEEREDIIEKIVKPTYSGISSK